MRDAKENVKIYEGFDERLSRIDRDRARMVHGYKAVVKDDGLIVFRAAKPRRQMPLRGLLLVIAAAVGFKALVFGAIGAEAYDVRLADLRAGTAVEQMAAVVLAPDAATRFVVAQVEGLLR